jgi:chromate reductase
MRPRDQTGAPNHYECPGTFRKPAARLLQYGAAARRYPPEVERLRTKIRQADALLFVSPEYNRSVPGVLKNAIDWASRAPDQPFDDKPVAIMGASPSMLGSAFANHHLRQNLVYLNAQMLNGPEVLVGGAAAKFDTQGRLTDETTCNFVASHLSGLKKLALRLKA